jgi:hypothetical protein
MRTNCPEAHLAARERTHERRVQFWRPWLVTFVAMFATDYAWSLYVAAIKNGLALPASGWAVALFLLGAVTVLGYTKNRWLLIPAALGAFAGTWAGVAFPV